MSFGQMEPSSALERAVAACTERGMVLVAAAGNGHSCGVEFPARYPEVVAVGGINQRGRRMRRSSCGPEVDLSAPGHRILSLRPGARLGVLSGTSMATAHVAGAAALLLGDRPHLSPPEVREVLMDTAEPLPGRREQVGAGLVRIDRALGAGKE